MGRGSVRQNKNKFQLIREDLGLSREKAAELLETVSPERIEKIESGKCAPYPEEVLAFARKYKRPSLCNYYCSQCCPIGKAYRRGQKASGISRQRHGGDRAFRGGYGICQGL